MPQKAQKAQSKLLCALLISCGVLSRRDLIVGSPVVVFGPLLVIVLRRTLIFAVVCNDFRRLFGRPLVLIAFLRESAHRHHAEHRNQDYFS
jgi:hypothetical protein